MEKTPIYALTLWTLNPRVSEEKVSTRSAETSANVGVSKNVVNIVSASLAQTQQRALRYAKVTVTQHVKQEP